MTVNITNITDANTTFQMFKAINEASGNLLGIFIIVFVWLIAFIGMKTSQNDYDTKVVFTVSSFVTMIVSFAFVFTDLVPFTLASIPMIATFIGIISVFIGKR